MFPPFKTIHTHPLFLTTAKPATPPVAPETALVPLAQLRPPKATN